LGTEKGKGKREGKGMEGCAWGKEKKRKGKGERETLP
jgi:hypothetical protein